MSSATQQLARILAKNHVAHSQISTLDIGRPAAAASAHGRPTPEDAPIPQRERVMVVVGAGASHNACNLPLGAKTAEILRRNIDVDNKLIERELDRLTSEHRLERNELETQLLALSRFDRQKLLEELRNLFSRRHYPSLTYEVLAHLLKHRFVDAIFNFNFDEILDQAIDDEVGAGCYYKVVSDVDCREPLEDLAGPQSRLRLPLYVKPHGTVSSKSSMRFTRGDYFLQPPELRKLTEELICNFPLRLIVIGHAMRSFEFNEVIRRHRPKDCCIFILLPAAKKYGKSDLAKELTGSVRFRDNPSSITYIDVIDDKRHNLDSILLRIWEQTERSLGSRNFPKPRGVKRHELITALFSQKLDSDNPQPMSQADEINYLKDRAIIETCLAVAKAKGFVHLRQLIHTRSGRYFNLYKLAAAEARTKSYQQFCEDHGLKVISGDTMRVGAEPAWLKDLRTPGPAWRLIRSRGQFKNSDIPQLLGNAEARLTPERCRLLNENKKLFRETLIEMYQGEEVEVATSSSAFECEYFADPLPLPTLACMKWATSRLLSTNWDLMLCVAETGEWLLGHEMVRHLTGRRRHVKIVVADYAFAKAVQGLSRRAGSKSNQGQRGNVQTHWLPWWLHNQHMTITVRNGNPLGAIFFERRLRSSTINPVYLSPMDAGRAVDKFVEYWLRSEGFTNEGRDPFVDREKVDSERGRVLNVHG